MLNTIEKLRKKPEPYRIKTAFIIAAIITGIIFLVWLSVVGLRFSQSAEVVREQDGPSLVAGVNSGFSEVFEKGRKQFDDSKKELENIFQQ